MPSTEDSLVTQYLPLVRRVALQLIARLPANVELDDLMQAGMQGLLDAVRRYQKSEHAQFETYASTRVRGAMLDELRSQDWLPRTVRSKARQIETAVQRLQHQLLRAPTETEIADALDLSLDDYRGLLEDAHGTQVVHYEDLYNPQGAETTDAGSLLASESSEDADPYSALFTKHLRQHLIQAIDALPERERLLLSLQFEHDMNQKEISLAMGVTEGRISQLRSQAIARIRAQLSSQDWVSQVPGSVVEKLL